MVKCSLRVSRDSCLDSLASIKEGVAPWCKGLEKASTACNLPMAIRFVFELLNLRPASVGGGPVPVTAAPVNCVEL